MRTNARGEAQNESIVFRVSHTDKVNIKTHAQELGTDISNLIKSLLIKERIIDPINKPHMK